MRKKLDQGKYSEVMNEIITGIVKTGDISEELLNQIGVDTKTYQNIKQGYEIYAQSSEEILEGLRTSEKTAYDYLTSIQVGPMERFSNWLSTTEFMQGTVAILQHLDLSFGEVLQGAAIFKYLGGGKAPFTVAARAAKVGVPKLLASVSAAASAAGVSAGAAVVAKLAGPVGVAISFIAGFGDC